MTEFLIVDEPEEEPELPKYSDPGNILVLVSGQKPEEIEVMGYDSGSSVLWLQEGMGVEYWVRGLAVTWAAPGYYMITGVKGEYIRGDGYTIDDDEDWEFDEIRLATFDDLDNYLG